MDKELILVVVGAVVCAVFSLSWTPLGRALAERLRGHAVVADEALRAELTGQREALLEEMARMRRELAELAERVDFAERLLSNARQGERLAPPRA